MADIRRYSVVESNNIQIGQVGSAFVDTTEKYTAPGSMKIVMITMLTDVEFGELTPTSTDDNFGTTAASPGTGGDTLTSSDTFPSGITIFGRWNSCELQTAGDKIIIYYGP